MPPCGGRSSGRDCVSVDSGDYTQQHCRELLGGGDTRQTLLKANCLPAGNGEVWADREERLGKDKVREKCQYETLGTCGEESDFLKKSS